MKKIIAIINKELSAYFQSPAAYIILIAATIVFNMFFFLIADQNQEAALRDIFRVMEFLFVFIIPILTMKVLAEERQNGTLEFLMTTPVTSMEIILGKYLGSLAFFSFMLVMTLPYWVILSVFAEPDHAAILTGYAGIWLEGAFFISIGVMTSAFSRNQIIAAILSYVIILFLYFCPALTVYAEGTLKTVLQNSAVMTHANNFFTGLITVRSLVYFLSGIVFCFAMARVGIEK